MIIVKIAKGAGTFAENKSAAKGIREAQIFPALSQGKECQLDFSGVEGATQSFIHALIKDPITKCGIDSIDLLEFKNCNQSIQSIIQTVLDYIQNGMIPDDEDIA